MKIPFVTLLDEYLNSLNKEHCFQWCEIGLNAFLFPFAMNVGLPIFKFSTLSFTKLTAYTGLFSEFLSVLFTSAWRKQITQHTFGRSTNHTSHVGLTECLTSCAIFGTLFLNTYSNYDFIYFSNEKHIKMIISCCKLFCGVQALTVICAEWCICVCLVKSRFSVYFICFSH